ncbi:unnamed protein product, partial [Discosporangium mesarthrocarpum]
SNQIISGRQLPKPGGRAKGEIIDPYVKVSMHGLPVDATAPSVTKTVWDNGFNPIWGESFTFDVWVPEMALLQLVVMDKDQVPSGIPDTFIAQAVLPVHAIRQGYRVVRLYSAQGTTHG